MNAGDPSVQIGVGDRSGDRRQDDGGGLALDLRLDFRRGGDVLVEGVEERQRVEAELVLRLVALAGCAGPVLIGGPILTTRNFDDSLLKSGCSPPTFG